MTDLSSTYIATAEARKRKSLEELMRIQTERTAIRFRIAEFTLLSIAVFCVGFAVAADF